jgi:hypothetical protein
MFSIEMRCHSAFGAAQQAFERFDRQLDGMAVFLAD